MDVSTLATIIMQKCRQYNAGGTEQSQLMAVAEEAGEFIGAMRRWRGMARRSGTEEEAQKELADLAITCYAMADVMGWDLDRLIDTKAEVILNRGWKESL